MAAKMAATAYISVTNSARRLITSGGSAVRLARSRRQRISNDKERVSAPAHRVGRGQTPISGQGRGPVGRSPRPKAQRDESGVGFLGMGQIAPSPPARGLGERCKLPRWGPERSRGR